jgi:Tht1-like nuclear fusion protein
MRSYLAISLLAVGAQVAHGLSWGSSHRQGMFSFRVRIVSAELREVPDSRRDIHSLSFEDQSRLSNSYALALSELRELESEPLCHRNAARLLVNHCQILEGKDEATVHTDSGRLTRDFVDSYATSLAICDLERGSFRIPSECNPFRETTLANLPIPSSPKLHVPTVQIDKCLEGLAQSDSAWNTWISYRHKALRFCDAARADNQKGKHTAVFRTSANEVDEHIRLYQRVSNILERLTTEVESHMESRLTSLNNALDRADSLVEGIHPRVDTISLGLLQVEEILAQKVFDAAVMSHRAVEQSVSEAETLHKLMAAMIAGVHRQQEDIVTSYETALTDIALRADTGVERIESSLSRAASAAALIGNELVSVSPSPGLL